MKSFGSDHCVSAAFGFLLLLVAHAGHSTAIELAAPEIRKLAILLDYGKGDLPVSAEELLKSLSSGKKDAAVSQSALRLQSPQKASFLITRRIPAEERATLPVDDPDEILQRYVVLEYSDTATTLGAKAVLEKDPLVIYVKESVFGRFLATPADPLYQFATPIQDYQWGINNPLNLTTAWNSVRGTAFLAHLDNGIQSGTVAGFPLHEDLGQPWRPQFNFNVAGGSDVDEHPELVFDPYSYSGHGTHTAGIMAGATSQASVPLGYPNPTNIGISGVCWYCNLMIARVSKIVNGAVQIDATVDLPNAINWAASTGAQVINLSLGSLDPNCTANPYDMYCLALTSAAAKEIVITAAAGNSDLFSGGSGNGLGPSLDFPAKSTLTIAVGAFQSYSGSRGNLWTEELPVSGFYGSSTGPGMETRGILAPGRDILSLFYYGKTWNAGARCGTTTSFTPPTPPAPGTSRGPNYGICTGTSMAAPHIAGLVGLLRTVNPLLNRSQITSALLASGDNAASPNTTRGYGVPNAGTAVNNVLATTNRLTPLFSQASSAAWDHFYTVVPQMARAAVKSGLLPYALAPTQYITYGTTIAEYPMFPHANGSGKTPKAQVWVFATHVNPIAGSPELTPLYRLSWKCGDPGTSVCASNPYHVSHVYTTSLAEAQGYIGLAYYKLDGIEGYTYPLDAGQPASTTMLMRAYNAAMDDYALFPAQEQANMAAQGYNQFVTNLGYVYRNTGSRPTY